jgi:hypothetical protein
MSLKVNEWPQKIIHYMAGKAIQMSIMIRELTGCAMIPSPDPEAHVRFKEYDPETSGKRSRHNVGEDGETRKSDGTDIFLNNSQAATFWMRCQASPDLGGFGLYFDTQLNGEKRVYGSALISQSVNTSISTKSRPDICAYLLTNWISFS